MLCTRKRNVSRRRFFYAHKACLDGEETAGCLAYFVSLVSRDCCVALTRGAMGKSVVCDCGIS